ncbi:MAG: succinate dehydrogenase/fumarate reductase cytochrome b subunit [Nitrospiraceae bacterium]|nr:MAG: succinate dehydrogenase/fumarate reductase cytochrome b subunit [Nitrospiraceae bacterium]
MLLFKNTVGRKIVMAVTGLLMFGFIIGHLLGNTTIFTGPDGINAYAEKLRNLGPLIWIMRVIMLVMVSLHVFFGVQITLEDNAAKPGSYAMKRNLRSTFASRSMIWTGLLIAGYLIYHLLQFTFHVINPEISSMKNFDSLGRHDVFSMLVHGFQSVLVSSVYIAAMIAVALHLAHGIQSLFQTLGLNNDSSLPAIEKAGLITAVILFLGYVSIPAAILAGIVK